MYWFDQTSSIAADSSSASTWKSRIDGLLGNADYFFSTDPSAKDVMQEPQCESSDSCNVDQLSFKSYLSRWLSEATQLAPYTYDTIMYKLRATAQSAVKKCQGGSSGTYCGFRWAGGRYDGSMGVGQQMGVLEVLQGLLVSNTSSPLTATTGGTSEGNSAAGTNTEDKTSPIEYAPITARVKAGAAIFTAAIFGVMMCALYLMLT